MELLCAVAATVSVRNDVKPGRLDAGAAICARTIIAGLDAAQRHFELAKFDLGRTPDSFQDLIVLALRRLVRKVRAQGFTFAGQIGANRCESRAQLVPPGFQPFAPGRHLPAGFAGQVLKPSRL